MTYDIANAVEDIKSISENRRMNVPQPSDEDLDEFEKEVGIHLSYDYRIFIKEVSTIMYGYLEMLILSKNWHGRGNIRDAIEENRRDAVPDGWIPICRDNGDYFFILPSGEVRFWSHDGDSQESWPNLAHWIRDVWIKSAT